MRPIKFRGRNAQGVWLTGYYLVNRGEHFISPDEFVNPLASPEDYRVDPTTVGQFTGCYMFDGKEVYEGDILHIEEDETFVVDFGCGCFGYWDELEEDHYSLPAYYFPNEKRDILYMGKILGNIHENPELLTKDVVE